MNAPLRIRELRLYRLAIPLRLRFEHAAAARQTADPVVVALTAGAPHAHHVGYGETLARPYVTGETTDSVIADITDLFPPHLANFEARTFIEALEQIDALPANDDGRIINAARTAVELALLDLASQAFRRRPADAAGWLGLPHFGPPGCLPTARYSGIVVGRRRRRLQSLLWLQRLYGLRDFKLKVATDGWEDRLRWTYEVLQRPLQNQTATLRVDANSGWSLADATEATPFLEAHGVSAIEQPLPDTHDSDLPYLAQQTHCDLIADESLLTGEDAQRLIQAGGIRVFNIRIAKNGGLLPSLRIARQALAAGRDVQLGCLVGETSLLTAAGCAFLETCPRVRFTEGAFGRLLLQHDITPRSLRFGYAGRLRPCRGFGWGVEVDPRRLERFATTRSRPLSLA